MKAAKDLGTITKLDRGMLTIYCHQWEIFVTASEEIKVTGIIVIGRHGDVMRNPAVDVADKAAGRMKMAAVELGFTPAARSKVYGDKKPEKTNFEKFKSRGGIKAAK